MNRRVLISRYHKQNNLIQVIINSLLHPRTKQVGVLKNNIPVFNPLYYKPRKIAPTFCLLLCFRDD